MEPIPRSYRKIFNDPIHGFISVPHEFIFELVEHPYFQRLRRIAQLGLTNIVYTGANHTRFQHALGAMHLMQQAIEVIRSKGHEITEAEATGVLVAILLHDIGHGPYSHTLEHSLVQGVNHEDLSLILMDKLNEEFEGRLDLAIRIFRNDYHKKFLHQLVSSQLDIDRLDYLKRDSFFSGVTEGVIGSERIIKMLQVVNGELAVEAKAIYSIEKFLMARRMMYWQVYLHKTVVGAEYLLMNILGRARELATLGIELFFTPALHTFLYNSWTREDFKNKPEVLEAFTLLDDFDIMGCVKVWANHSDNVLNKLCTCLVGRNLLKVDLRNAPFTAAEVAQKKQTVMKATGLSEEEVDYFVFTDQITNSAYQAESDQIGILYKDGTLVDLANAADLFDISQLSKPVIKHFLCSPKLV